LELFSASTSAQNPIILREDESVKFTTILDADLFNLTLVLHENEVPYTRREEKSGRWIYEWLPKEIYNRKESFFHNYFGLAELSLIAKNPQDTSSFIFFEELRPIEILARKINAERIASMLDFLAQQDGKDLASAIRITRMRAGYKKGGRTEVFLLERIENNLAFIKKLFPSIVHRPIIKLNQITRLVVPNQDTLIDERSLSWITENPDYLYRATSLDESILNYDDENFSASKIIECQTESSFNVYENQVLHGFLVTLITATKQIQSKLSIASKVQEQVADGFEGYVSFFSQINKFSAAINKNKIDKCSRLIAELYRVRIWLIERIPVKKVYLGIPKFTQKAKFNILYSQVFNRMISWHRYGAPDWGFQEELNSIKDIPKLFEYYLLCVIKNHLDSLVSIGCLLTPDIESQNSDVFEYKWGLFRIRLTYEPDIWAVGHSQSRSMNLVNTEGWTVNSNDSGWSMANKDITQRGSRGRYAKRCPDIIIEISKLGGQSAYFIIDAKYTDGKRAFLNYLPELTMKYLHGIHQQGSGKSLSVALMIVNPEEIPNTRHYHHDDYNIYGEYPVIPALMVSSIDVSKAHHPDSNIRSDVAKVLELMINKLQ